jgi:hypothetical protein
MSVSMRELQNPLSRGLTAIAGIGILLAGLFMIQVPVWEFTHAEWSSIKWQGFTAVFSGATITYIASGLLVLAIAKQKIWTTQSIYLLGITAFGALVLVGGLYYLDWHHLLYHYAA